MKQIIHPNQFPSILTTLEEEEEPTDGMKAALRFLEGIDYDEDSHQRRRPRRAERSVTAKGRSMVKHTAIGR